MRRACLTLQIFSTISVQFIYLHCYYLCLHPRTYLKVYNNGKDQDGGHQVHQVGQVLAVEGLPQSLDLVRACSQQMEEGDDGSFKLCPSPGVDGGRAERLPHDGLADVGGDEEGYARAKPIALLKQLVQQEHNQASTHKLPKGSQKK